MPDDCHDARVGDGRRLRPMPDGFRYHKSCVHPMTKVWLFRQRLPGGLTRVVGEPHRGVPWVPIQASPARLLLVRILLQRLVCVRSDCRSKVHLWRQSGLFLWTKVAWATGIVICMFNGLEDGGGMVQLLILQPSTFGKSGCLLNQQAGVSGTLAPTWSMVTVEHTVENTSQSNRTKRLLAMMSRATIRGRDYSSGKRWQGKPGVYVGTLETNT